MIDKVLEDLQELLTAGGHQRVLLALSGGQDSMALLDLLHVSRETLGITLGLAHVNHGQRPESSEEEAYLRQLAADLELPIYVGKFSGKFTEKNARECRYDFFKTIMVTHDYTALLTAHHQDDQVETIVMRLIRGSRLRHLTGIPLVQNFGPGQLIRPLLGLKKADLPSVFHFEDQSNQSLTYFRNRVRLVHVPQLTGENPQFPKHMLALSQQVSNLYQALRDLTGEIEVTNLLQWRGQSPAVQSFLLEEYLAQFPDLHVTRDQFAQMQQVLNKEGNYHGHLKSGYWLTKDYDSFAITKINPETDDELEARVLDYGDSLVYGAYEWAFLGNSEAGYALPSQSPILLRRVQAGDRLDMGQFSKKVSRLFIDDKVPLSERREALVVEQDGMVQLILTKRKTYLRKLEKHAIMKASLIIKKKEW